MLRPAVIAQMLEALARTGLSETDIAALVGCRQPTINRIRSGKIRDPKHSLAAAIERLHAQRCGRRRVAATESLERAA